MFYNQPGQTVSPDAPRQETSSRSAYGLYIHNPQLYQEELEQFQVQFRRRQTRRTRRKLLCAFLILLVANLIVVAWYLLRLQGILP